MSSAAGENQWVGVGGVILTSQSEYQRIHTGPQ